GHEQDVRVARIDDHLADLPRVVETEMRPGLAGVAGSVHTVAVRDLRPHVRLAGADIDDVGIRRGDGNRANGGDRLRVEDRLPRAARVRRLPDAAAPRTEVERARLTGHAADAVHAAAAKRSDHPPAEAAEERRIDAALLSGELRDARKRAGEQR